MTNPEVLEANMCSMQKQLDSIEAKLDKMITSMEEKYVTKEQFSTVKNIVYWMVWAVLLAVVGGVMTLLLK